MVCGVFVAGIAGMFGYLVVGFVAHALPAALYFVYVLIPLLIGVLIVGGISRALLREERVDRPGVGRHLWHCAVFYPVVVWTVYQVIDWRSVWRAWPRFSRIPGRCGGGEEFVVTHSRAPPFGSFEPGVTQLSLLLG
jgi:hypothetical protein